jgi:hypothetical protein
MKNLSRILLVLMTVLLLSACGPKATETPMFQGNNPYAPQPSDADMMRNDVTIDSSSLSQTKSLPPQVILNFAYFPPTVCHELRVEVAAPDAQNQIKVTAYGVAEKDKPCILMMPTTPTDASLNLGSYPSGHYSVLLNGTLVGEFDS